MRPATLWTPRLRLEPWGDEHRQLFVELARLPEVIRYVGDGQPWSQSRATAVSQASLQHWQRHGFGWRAVFERRSDQPLGLAALNFAGEGAGVDADEYEIGWWLHPSAWGRGFARESAGAVRDEGFTRLEAPSLLARIQPANAASLAVATAIGLVPESDSRGRAGETIAVLRMTAQDWRRSQAAAASA